MAYAPAADIPGVEDLVEIGRGGFSVVYRGRQPDLGRDVAVKVVSSTGAGAELERWRREIVAMARLTNHPNILAVYAGGVTDDGSPYIVMPYVPGGSLHDRVKAQGPLGAEETATLGAKLAGALASAHDAGVLHRDVKPENVLLSPYGEPQLTDFGIARLLDATATASGKVHATIPYAAPEVLAGQPATEAADVYGLGATLHAVLTGAPPFATRDDESLVAFVGRIVHTPAPDLRAVGVPDQLATVIEDALAKDPKDRTPTADALRARLEEAIPALAAAPEPTIAPTVFALDAAPDPPTEQLEPVPAAAVAVDPGPPPVRRPPARRGGSAFAVLVGLIGLALLAVVVALALRDDDDADPTAATDTTTAPTEPAVDPATEEDEEPTTTAAPVDEGDDAAGEEGQGAGAELGDTARTYFDRIAAGDLDAAYGMLSPDFRAVQSRASYEAFWGGFGSVEVAGGPEVDGDGRRVTVPLRLDGRSERFTLTLAPRDDGGWWIDGPRPG